MTEREGTESTVSVTERGGTESTVSVAEREGTVSTVGVGLGRGVKCYLINTLWISHIPTCETIGL